mgnify:CR=1 FL=1
MGVDAVILGREDLRMIGFEGELGLVLLLLAEPVETLDLRLAVRAVLPFAGRPPRELRPPAARLFSASRARQQRIDVDSVVDARSSHGDPPRSGKQLARRESLAGRLLRIMNPGRLNGRYDPSR